MKCKICNKDMEYYGSKFIIIGGIKYKQDYGICRMHIPYTPITLIVNIPVE